MDGPLIQQQLQGLGVMEAHPVRVGDGAPLRCQLSIRTRVQQQDSRIHKVRLTLRLVRTQAGQKTILTYELHAGPGEPNAFAVPQAEDPPSKVWLIDDRIKTAASAVARIAITRREETGDAKPHPVFIHG